MEAEFSVFRPWIDTYRGITKENLHLYCVQYNFLRNTKREERTRRTIVMLIIPLTNMEEPCTIRLICATYKYLDQKVRVSLKYEQFNGGK